MKRQVANPTAPRTPMLELMVTAALTGHDLTRFDPIPSGGYQAACRRCHQTVWVGGDGLIYSLLAAACPSGAA